jgi:hypothetical protein
MGSELQVRCYLSDIPEIKYDLHLPASNTAFVQTPQVSTPLITFSQSVMDSRSLISQLSVALAETLTPTTDENYPR